MRASDLLTETLKRELKARGLTYAGLADRLGLSEASVKRMFSNRNFDLKRLDAVLAALEIDFAQLAAGLRRDERLISGLAWSQEEEIVADPLLFTVAVCALHLMDFGQITRIYRISDAQCVACLARLDRIGFLRLLPNNRWRLLVSRTFQWIPDGPIARYFRSQAQDFFDWRFDGPGEAMQVLNVRVSEEARVALLARLQQVLREYSDQHNADARLPLARRHPMSVLVAARPWEPRFMAGLRRETPSP